MNDRPADRRASQQQIKACNLNLLLGLLDRQEPLSRARLAEMTNLSPTTVSALVDALIRRGLVMELGPEDGTGLGRKAIQLQVNPAGACVASLELVEGGLRSGLYDLKGRRLAQTTTALSDAGAAGAAMAQEVRRLLAGQSLPESALAAVCVAVPGMIDVDRKRVIASTVLPIGPENPFADVLEEAFPATAVLVGNESSFCAYLEASECLRQGIRDLILVDINTGVGSGIILDGRIFGGAMGIAGELGHVTVDLNGPRCKCGSRGCLEVMASVPALLQRALLAVVTRRSEGLSRLCEGDPARLTLPMVAAALNSGDPVTEELVSDTARYLAFGLNNAINLINPRAILLSGQISLLGDRFLAMLKDHLAEIAFHYSINNLLVRFSAMDDFAALDGGARYALDNLFDCGILVEDLVR